MLSADLSRGRQQRDEEIADESKGQLYFESQYAALGKIREQSESLWTLVILGVPTS